MNIFIQLIFNICSFFLRNKSSCILKKADPWHLPTIILPPKTWQHIRIDRIFYPKAVTTCLERRNCFSLFIPDTVNANNYGKSQIFASKIIIFSRCKTYNRRTRFLFLISLLKYHKPSLKHFGIYRCNRAINITKCDTLERASL